MITTEQLAALESLAKEAIRGPCIGKCPVCGQDENGKCGGGDK